MKITWDNLLERIKDAPLEHLGGFSPRLVLAYFFGYDLALQFHGHQEIEGTFGLYEFNRWFISKAYAGPQGWASYCLLLTNTNEDALDLFFEFRRLAKASDWADEDRLQSSPPDHRLSFLELLHSDGLRERPAMYFGNTEWIRAIWAMWNGYVWAEQDIGVKDSVDAEAFRGFQDWLKQRFGFAQDSNFGKIFEFNALDINEKALQDFFDHLEIFLEGSAPDGRTKRFQSFLDDAVAAALKEQQRKSE
jgi:hypothetical protein